jgi:hypothetical protein
MTAVQREEPVAASGGTHGMRHQADVRIGHPSWPERQLCEVQLTLVCGRAISWLQRLLAFRANWRYRPTPYLRVSPKLPVAKRWLFVFRFHEAAVRQPRQPAKGGRSDARLQLRLEVERLLVHHLACVVANSVVAAFCRRS